MELNFDMNYFKKEAIEKMKYAIKHHSGDLILFDYATILASEVQAMYTFCMFNNIISDKEYFEFSEVNFREKLVGMMGGE